MATPKLQIPAPTEDRLSKATLLGMIAMGLSQLKSDPEAPDYKTLRITGFLGRPNSPDLRF